MKPYPNNSIKFDVITPEYKSNTTQNKDSRYSIYRVIDNLPNDTLEVRLINSISKNSTYKGYYYTTRSRETLYSIAKKYYDKESFYWIIAKANGLKDDGLSVIPIGTTLVIPNYIELQKSGGYFTNNI